MRVLLIHQNFPAQFCHLAPQLIARGHELVALGRRRQDPGIAGVIYGHYSVSEPDVASACSDEQLELALRCAERVRLACLQLRQSGWRADAVLFHSSWGEGLYLREIWPEQRLVAYPELYGTPRALGYGFDPALGEPSPELCAAIRHRNLLSLAAIADSDALVVPTRFQRDSFPAGLRAPFHVIHEGVDVERLAPYPGRWLVFGPELAFRQGDPVVTFCSRHLEPLRGLTTLLRCLPLLQRAHRQVQVLIAGDGGKGYGPGSRHPGGHLGALLEELEGRLDLERIHLLGRVQHGQLLGLYQASAAHVYLTYPYTLSWSLLEAMACGAPVIGSHGPPVDEVIVPGENGLLVDFHSPEQLAEAILRLLADRALGQRLGQAARRTVMERYSLVPCARAYEALLRGEAA